MVRDLATALPPPVPPRAGPRAVEGEPRGAAGDALPGPAAATVEPVPPVEQAVQLAASALFRGRAVEVRGFVDDGSGRFVYRIADRQSGEVLMQSPPEALLRFFASARAALGPMVRIEA